MLKTRTFQVGTHLRRSSKLSNRIKRIPKAAEAHAVYRDGTLNLTVGAKLHITHLSTVMGLDTISFLKHLGSHITADVTPHHLLFDDTAYLEYETKLKANPPFGDDRDRKALIHALRSAEIAAIATDHALTPNPKKTKNGKMRLMALPALTQPLKLFMKD